MIDRETLTRWLARICALAFVPAVASYVQYRWELPDRSIDATSIRPYAALKIATDRIYQTRVRSAGGALSWELHFPVMVIDKRQNCAQVEWDLRLQQQSAPAPLASDLFRAPQVAPPGERLTVLPDVKLDIGPAPLAVGEYTMNVTSTCYVETSSGLEPLAPAASAEIACFAALDGQHAPMLRMEPRDCPVITPLTQRDMELRGWMLPEVAAAERR